MKYGKFLQSNKILEFEQYYVDYKALKQICKECQFDPSGATFINPSVSKQSPNALFIRELFDAAEKLSSDSHMLFGEAKARAITLMTSIIERSKEHFHLVNEVEAFALHITQLDTFLHQNIEAIRKIVKKYDKKTKERNITWVARQSRPIHDVKSALSKFVVTISDMFLLLRQWEEQEKCAEAGATWNPKAWTPPETFERKSTKYLVRMDNLLKVKMAIVKNLPLLVIGRKEPTQETADTSDILKTNDHGLISSIYVDTEDLYTYHQRANREEGNQLIRFRWYNTYVPGDTVFCERKTHHESWVGESSLKERFPMPTNKVQEFTEGTWLPEDEKNLALAHQIQSEFKDKQYKPSVRTVYQRTAFQLASSNDLRISLDADLSFQNEKRDWKNFDSQDWHDNVSSDGLTNFQHFGWAVLEVKISAGQTPEWVEALVQDETLVKDVPKFSKFLHSTALFHQNGNGLRVLPYWWDDEELVDECVLAKENGRDSQQIFANVRASKCIEDEKKGWFNFTTPSFLPWGKKKSKDSDSDSETSKSIPTYKGTQGKIEPKTYFANERTFIQWAALAVSFIIFAAVIEKVATVYDNNVYVYVFGITMVIAGVLMLGFAVFQYFRRIQKIKRRDQEGYEDRVGPLFFALIIFLVAAVAFIPSVMFLKDKHWSNPALVGIGVVVPVQWPNVFTAQPSDVIPLNADQLMVPSMDGYYLVNKNTWGDAEFVQVKRAMDVEAVTTVGDKAFFLSESNPAGIQEWDMTNRKLGRTFPMAEDAKGKGREGEAMAYCPQCTHLVPAEFHETHYPMWVSGRGNKVQLLGIPKTGEGVLEEFMTFNNDFICFSEPRNGLHDSWKFFKDTKECKDNLKRPRAAWVADSPEGPQLWLLIGTVMNVGRVKESREQFIVSIALDAAAKNNMDWRMFPVPDTKGTYEGFSFEETSPGQYTAYLVDDNAKTLVTAAFDPLTGFH